MLYLVCDLRKVGVYGDNPVSSPIKTGIVWKENGKQTKAKTKHKQSKTKKQNKHKQSKTKYKNQNDA